MNTYLIPGLGADKKVFKNIHLPAGYNPVFLEWLYPEKKESLVHYAERLSHSVSTDEDFILIGLSFGGMLATEIAKIKRPVRLILISSIASSSELAPYFRAAGKMKLQHLLPLSFFKSAAMIKRLFTAETPEEKSMLRQMIREADPQFIHWALDAILAWDNKNPPAGYIHIHGTGDELLPFKYTKATHAIKKGGHMMIMNRAGEINTILEEVLAHTVVSN